MMPGFLTTYLIKVAFQPQSFFEQVWDMNGSCLHTLVCPQNSFLDIAQVVILKRAVIVMGGSKHFMIFKLTNFGDHYVFPSEWKSPPVS